MTFCECGCGRETKPARQNHTASGRVKGQPVRFALGCGPGRTRIALEEGRAWIAQDSGYETPCWVWQHGTNAKGYGKTGDNRPAHRAVFLHLGGTIPDGFDIDHLCRNRTCVNPAHLEPVTRAENSRRGEKTKLTREDVDYIRTSSASHVDVARRLGVSGRHVSHIRAGKRWVAA